MRRIERWTDERLLSATRRGEAEAFGVFFSRHAQAVLVFVRRRCGSAELAAEVTAETFAAALLAVHRGRAEHVREGAPWLLWDRPAQADRQLPGGECPGRCSA
jgi:DNA-directed RNA polymerase specialized sigma24 family protein